MAANNLSTVEIPDIQTPRGPTEAFVVPVRDDSMWPRYKPGEYALVEPSIAPEIGDDVLVRLTTGETMIRRLLSRDGGNQLGSLKTDDVLIAFPDDIASMHYVAHQVPAHKAKFWRSA